MSWDVWYNKVHVTECCCRQLSILRLFVPPFVIFP